MLVRCAKKRIEVGNAGVAEERKLFEWEYVGRGGESRDGDGEAWIDTYCTMFIVDGEDGG